MISRQRTPAENARVFIVAAAFVGVPAGHALHRQRWQLQRLRREHGCRRQPIEGGEGGFGRGQEQALRGHAGKRRQAFFQQAVADDDEADVPVHVHAPVPEQFHPFLRAQQIQQRGLCAGKQHAAFVQQRELVTLPAALRALLRLLCQHFAVALVERGLQFGKAQPDQGVEKVVQVIFARRHLAAGGNALLVFRRRAGSGQTGETQGLRSVGVAGIEAFRHFVQRSQASPAPQQCKQVAVGLEGGMRVVVQLSRCESLARYVRVRACSGPSRSNSASSA